MERLFPDPKIRLLHLLPGTGSEPLRCSLEVAVPFRSATGLSYEAISYAWGDGASTEVIWCDGKRKTITSSLATALRRVRLVDRTRVLWADGICINQKDLDECEQQVRLMAAIYSQATQVL
ncbi:heterokaryon incompatibility protein-domain-containing protein, partial [Tricladium varicosporioides]